MKKNNNTVILFIFFAFITIILIIAYGLSLTKSNGYEDIKIDSSKDLIYTKDEIKSGNEYYQTIPYVNIIGENATLINENIQGYMNSYNKTNINIKYDYTVNGKILSLILIVEDHTYIESATVLHFRAYNFNLDTLEIISDETMLKYYDLTSDNALIALNEAIKKYYNDLVSSNKIDQNDCNYNCFVGSRNFQNTMEDAEYYVRKGKLVVFKPYTYISLSEDDEITYSFEIA